MRYSKTLYYQIRIVIDILIISLTFFFVYYFKYLEEKNRILFNYDFLILLTSLFFWYIISQNLDLYNESRTRTIFYEIILTLKAVFFFTLFMATISFIIKSEKIDRGLILYFTILLILLLIIGKLITKYLLMYLRSKGKNLRNIVIIGAGPIGQKFYNLITENPHYGYNFVGFLDDNAHNKIYGKYLGKLDDLEKIFENNNIDDVIIALPNYAEKKIEQIINKCQEYTTRVRIIPDIFKYTPRNYFLDVFIDLPIIYLKKEKLNEFHWNLIKRLFDLIFSFLVIVLLLSWLIPIVSILIKLDSKGPVFFVQERWGKSNKKFKILKFRTMIATSNDVDENGNYLQAKKNDPRITRIGKFLRKLNIDELPQFINVFLGDMSIVGPRPHPIPLNLESKKIIPKYMQRTLVKPGITGWAQVNGYRGETKDDQQKMTKRVEYDLWYIENWSFWLDLQIIFMTIWRMFKGDPHAY